MSSETSNSKKLAQIGNDSSRLRHQVQSRLRSLPLDVYHEESTEIVRHLASWDILQKAEVVAAFHPSRTEPQIQPLLKSLVSQKVLLLPRVLPGNNMEMVQVEDLHRDIHPGSFGLQEPHLSLKAWTGASPSVFLIPGVVFGKYGERIGHGGGYYDRFLAEYPETIRVGVALSCQILSRKIPQNPHDIRMSYIVAPIGILPTS
ncbi:MAG TPA: 5-formyltetrahydrofolate cyclo-ligase [Fibrobacteraceae bacterium]|nr:5-formyltetrahydrofolate cyclo-ligase [Fibrobacteraceae bacterium]